MKVYGVTCKKNGMIYVGATINEPEVRWSAHKSGAKRGDNGYGGEFYGDIRKYGEESFSLTTLEDGIASKSDLRDRENFWIDKYRAEGTAYNTCGSTVKGFKHTDETRTKMSAASKGKKKPPFSDEHRARMSAAHKGKERKPFSDEHKAKMSAAMKGRQFSDEAKAKMSAAAKNRKPMSDETRARISAASKAYWAKRRADKNKNAQLKGV